MSRSYQFKAGALECSAVSDGYHEYEPSSFFVGVPEEVVREELSALGQTNGKVTTPYTFLLVNTGGTRVLVDTGAGSLLPETGRLVKSLEAAGERPETIDTVVITHAHPDHIGGMLDGDGKLVYPNARYYTSRLEWEFWLTDESKATQPKSRIDLARTALKTVESRLTLIDDDTELLPGVRMIPTPGHTPGHTAIAFRSDGQTLVYAADTALFPLHVSHPNWKNKFDWDPKVADESRRAFCEQAARGDWLLMFQHFPPFPSLGRVEAQDDGWRWIPVEV